MVMAVKDDEKTVKYSTDYILREPNCDMNTETKKIRISESCDALAEMEAALDRIADDRPRIESEAAGSKESNDLKAVLQVSLAVNSSLVLEDILKIVMKKAVELLSAERGFIMLLDDNGELLFKTVHNIRKESLNQEDFIISRSVANEVAATGKSVYTSDALSDERYANQKSIVELHLRSIMCVPLKIKNTVIGLIYLDNSSEARLFLKSDLYLFELFAQQAAHAIHNATLYDDLLDLKKFNDKVIDKSPVGVVVIDSDYYLVSINDAALSILEKNKGDVSLLGTKEVPSDFLDIIPSREVSKWRKMIKTVLVSHQPLEDSRYFHNTGYNEKVLTVKISPISKIPYGGDGLILVLEDITEKVIMEKYVILSEKLVARGEMAASIGHELNNYLAIIANNAELLAHNLGNNNTDKVKFNSKQILENISKMTRFTNGLMDFSKLEVEFVSYDVDHLIEELLFSLKAQSRFKDISFSLDLAEGLRSIEIDVGQIQQVLMNLLYNAADAMEDRYNREIAEGNNDFKKEITIKAFPDTTKSIVSISISDNGSGISKENMVNIFKLHFTTKKSGHGIGLSNCRKIIESHNGEITLSSTEGVGTIFTITLPEKQPEEKMIV
jgi:signal transduction histidine kinase